MNHLCNATDLSDYIVDKCYDDCKDITNLILQQMMYIIQIAYCSVTKGRLLFLDKFIATDYGPKIPEVRDRYNPFLCTPKNKFIKVVIRDKSIREFVDNGMNFVFSSSPWRLNDILKEVGSPWQTAYLRDDKVIDYNEFIQYYSNGDRFDSIKSI